MKWSRAAHHLESVARVCAGLAEAPNPILKLRVTQAWAVGDVLGPPVDLDTVTVALCVDLPPGDVPWWGEPPGAQQWANATRLATSPVLTWWRSASAPVWNHRIERPALLWDQGEGVREEVLAAIRDGRGEDVRTPAPEPDALRVRLGEELTVSLRSLRATTRSYEERRWRPGKLEPTADALWRASDGYLDVLDALGQDDRA